MIGTFIVERFEQETTGRLNLKMRMGLICSACTILVQATTAK